MTSDYLSVTKFNGYWEKGADGQTQPYLDGVRYVRVTDATVRLNNLKTGSLDSIQALAAKDVPAMLTQKDLIYSKVLGLEYQGLSLNHKKPPYDKLEARQAIAISADCEAYVKSILFDTATAGRGPLA